jgi:16S rRNA (uracil1498-N3)-methyltransferase
MSRRRWIADEVFGRRAAVTGEHARHLAEVLRVQVGEEFEISTGSELWRGRAIQVDPDRVEFELSETLHSPQAAEITVALSIFKFHRLEWAIEKCTELGVAKMIPVIAARSDTHLVAAARTRTERWRRIARQAAEQSRRISAPEITQPFEFDELVRMLVEPRIVLSETEPDRLLKHVIPRPSRSLLLAIGPEGGWKDQEIAAFRQHGWSSASLGPSILRAETAVIAAVAIAASVLA